MGLDYYYDHSPRAAQRAAFVAQLHYARERGLPAVFHQRDAFCDFIDVLHEEWHDGMRGVGRGRCDDRQHQGRRVR